MLKKFRVLWPDSILSKVFSNIKACVFLCQVWNHGCDIEKNYWFINCQHHVIVDIWLTSIKSETLIVFWTFFFTAAHAPTPRTPSRSLQSGRRLVPSSSWMSWSSSSSSPSSSITGRLQFASPNERKRRRRRLRWRGTNSRWRMRRKPPFFDANWSESVTGSRNSTPSARDLVTIRWFLLPLQKVFEGLLLRVT